MLSNCENWKRQSSIALLLNWSKFIGMSIHHIYLLSIDLFNFGLFGAVHSLYWYFYFHYVLCVVVVCLPWRSTSVMRLADFGCQWRFVQNFLYLTVNPTLLLWNRHKSGVIVQLRWLSLLFYVTITLCDLHAVFHGISRAHSIAISMKLAHIRLTGSAA